MNKQSNTYIIIYATILVVVVASVLSFAAIQLQPMQQENVKVEKMGAILASIGQGNDPKELSKDKAGYISTEYQTYITATYAVAKDGEKIPGVDAFESLDNLAESYASGILPVFEATVDGELQYIIPVTGKGLWGAIWGYLSLADDCNTILGAKFDHSGETPGLGAEIATQPFESQFTGKELFNETGEFVSVNITKGVGSSSGNIHAVDAVSGGTLTSNGVKAMLTDCLKQYIPFFEKQTRQTTVDSTSGATATTTDGTSGATPTTEDKGEQETPLTEGEAQ